MLRRLKQRVTDAATLAVLCRSAEAHARQDGQSEPGAEHFLLAALDLPDGSARRAFTRIGADPDGVKSAIARQYDEALHRIGLDPAGLAPAPEPLGAPASGLYSAAPSGRELVQRLAKAHRIGRSGPLFAAHVVEAVAETPHGVSARALRTMGVDLEALGLAARAEAEGTRATAA
jgi:hypothetical protein